MTEKNTLIHQVIYFDYLIKICDEKINLEELYYAYCKTTDKYFYEEKTVKPYVTKDEIKMCFGIFTDKIIMDFIYNLDTTYIPNIFYFKNKIINVVFDISGNPWFKGHDIINIIINDKKSYEYKNTIMKENIDENNLKIINEQYFDNAYKKPVETTFYINKDGIYSLIILFNNKENLLFKAWVETKLLDYIKNKQEQDIKKEIKELIEKEPIFTKKDYIYISTTKTKSLKNIFKIDKTDDLNRELSHNINYGNDDVYFCFFEQVYNADEILNQAINFLKKFECPNSNGTIILQYTLLEEIIIKIIDNNNKMYEFCKNFIKNKILFNTLKPIIADRKTIKKENN